MNKINKIQSQHDKFAIRAQCTSFSFRSFFVSCVVRFSRRFLFSLSLFPFVMLWPSFHSKGCHKMKGVVTPASLTLFHTNHHSAFAVRYSPHIIFWSMVILNTGVYTNQSMNQQRLIFNIENLSYKKGNAKKKFVFGFTDILTATTRIILFECEWGGDRCAHNCVKWTFFLRPFFVCFSFSTHKQQQKDWVKRMWMFE